MLVGLSACATVQTVSQFMSQFDPLYINDFCNQRSQDLAAAKAKYEGRRYVWEGTITNIQKQNDHTVIGIESEDGKAWAKVYNYSGQVKTGQLVYIEATISAANFEQSRVGQCQLLLDDGKIVTK